MNQIYLVHPEYGKLRFFRPLIYNLRERYRSYFRYFKLNNNDLSHTMCLDALKGAHNAMVIFLCHGEDKNLRGCHCESLNSVKYHYGTLISPTKNINVFTDNKVFCLACESKSLGPHAINAGAKVYIGFDEVPFSIDGANIGKKALEKLKHELRSAVLSSLIISIENNYTFNELSLILKLLINKIRIGLISDTTKNGRKRRVRIANVLGRVNNGITLFGNGEIRIND